MEMPVFFGKTSVSNIITEKSSAFRKFSGKNIQMVRAKGLTCSQEKCFHINGNFTKKYHNSALGELVHALK